MLNQCSFIGNLGRDPEVRTFGNGGKVCNLRLAVSEKWRDKESGERKESTEWVSVAVFNDGLVRVCEQYLKKGSKVFVQGKLKTRKYQAQDGSDRYSTEVVLQGFGGTLTMLDGPSGGGQSDNYSGTAYDNAIGSNANAGSTGNYDAPYDAGERGRQNDERASGAAGFDDSDIPF